jgi:hypothetical protein
LPGFLFATALRPAVDFRVFAAFFFVDDFFTAALEDFLAERAGNRQPPAGLLPEAKDVAPRPDFGQNGPRPFCETHCFYRPHFPEGEIDPPFSFH